MKSRAQFTLCSLERYTWGIAEVISDTKTPQGYHTAGFCDLDSGRALGKRETCMGWAGHKAKKCSSFSELQIHMEELFLGKENRALSQGQWQFPFTELN